MKASKKKENVFLHFKNGDVFPGYLYPNRFKFHQDFEVLGKTVFTTGHTGYVESMTDPSFLGQHLIFTVAHVGNYPACESAMQSAKTPIVSMLAQNITPNPFFDSLDIPIVELTDTRKLVQVIRDGQVGSIAILSKDNQPLAKESFDANLLKCNQLSLVSCPKPQVLRAGENPIVYFDYGTKNAITECLMELNLPLVQVPYNFDFESVLKLKPRLVFLSNGPGDPSSYKFQIEVVSKILQAQIPTWGICLGHQLISLALEAQTFELPFGHRGTNHPVLNLQTGEVIITSQNHGFAVCEKSFEKICSMESNRFKKHFFIHYKSLFDGSVEGLSSVDKTIRSVQFHPEASPGPKEGKQFFHELKEFLHSSKIQPFDISLLQEQNKYTKIESLKSKSTQSFRDHGVKKILVIGSGPIKIGQAQEFDYSGTQALQALKEEGIQVVLLNSNPATIMTDPKLSYRTYIEPITIDIVKKIILKEEIDAILSTMGGQTALNICCALDKEDFLKQNNIRILGSQISTIKMTEDRDIFRSELETLGIATPKRFRVHDPQSAQKVILGELTFPFIIRRDFALGGEGAKTIYSLDDFNTLVKQDLKFPLTLEQNLHGYKEIELEVMVDKDKNAVIICSIENVDPCGIHTGDSITVAPAQTLSDRLYQDLRTKALTIAKHVGIQAGGANVQFAIHPQNEDDVVVIEMNPRVSRSSALASKATGYPVAKISTKLALGYTLKEILNEITCKAPVAFEPSLDYVAVKIPKFAFDKFPLASSKLGPQMKAVGEVLAIGGSFNEAFFKALRSLEEGLEFPALSALKNFYQQINPNTILKRLNNKEPLGLLTCLEALRLNISKEMISQATQISPWFLDRMQDIVEIETEFKNTNLKELVEEKTDLFWQAKKNGLADAHLAKLLRTSEYLVFVNRRELNIVPSFKAVDTCSGEFEAKTPYFYSTYRHTQAHDAPALKPGKSYAIIGSGPNRIGQGIEFDYSGVMCAQILREEKQATLFINSNPGTVSTDYDTSDRLYFSPLSGEDVYEIFLYENPGSLIAAFSGQTGISLRNQIENSFRHTYQNFRFLGIPFKTIELTENRKLFDEILKKIGQKRLPSQMVDNFSSLEKAYKELGTPLMLRPNFVIGGESMYILLNDHDFEGFKQKFETYASKDQSTFLVERYLDQAIEFDVDFIRDVNGNHIFTVCEHIEYAGVHSGDSGMICPPIYHKKEVIKELKKISMDMAEELSLLGPLNIQFAIKDTEIYCIEANPRGSRTIPFLSKASNIPLIKYATYALMGKKIPNKDHVKSNHYFVKQSTFPFDRFADDSSLLGPKMRSTGETMGVSFSKAEAVLKSYLGNYPNINLPGKIVISLSEEHKPLIVPYLKQLDQLGFKFCATEGTHQLVQSHDFSCQKLSKIGQAGTTILDLIKYGEVRFVLNTPSLPLKSKSDGDQIRQMASLCGIPCFTRPENIKSLLDSLVEMGDQNLGPVSLQEIYE